MKTKTRANAVSGCSFEEPFDRFAREFLRFATAKSAVDVASPCAGVLIMSDDPSLENVTRHELLTRQLKSEDPYTILDSL